METLFTVLSFVLAFYSAYQAGQFKAMIDIDQADGRKADKQCYILWALNIGISIYFIISVYGAGIRAGLSM